jgi:hypothetical protein
MCAMCVRGSERGRFSIALLIASFLAAPAIAGEIFKCVAKDGIPLYQNFPCYIDSIGSLPSDPPAAKTPSIPGAAGQEKSKAALAKTKPVNVALIKPTHIEPRVGMTEDEIRALLGEPQEMVDDEPAEGGRVSTWRYADGRTILFANKHRVLEIRR